MTLPSMPHTIEYEDYDGFLAFADAPSYDGYVGDEWEMPSIVAKFADQSRAGTLTVQYVGEENSSASIDFLTEPSAASAVREISLPLTITSGALWVTTYGDLTSVAQFDDEELSEQDSTEPVIALDNGDYTLNFRWLTFRDEEDDWEEEPARLEVVITPGSCAAPETFPGAAELLS